MGKSLPGFLAGETPPMPYTFPIVVKSQAVPWSTPSNWEVSSEYCWLSRRDKPGQDQAGLIDNLVFPEGAQNLKELMPLMWAAEAQE